MRKIITITCFAFIAKSFASMSLYAQESTAYFEKHYFIEGTDTLPYRLLVPESVKRGKKYPLVIFLHGAGERGRDNEINLKYVSSLFLKPDNRKKFPAYVVIPQCPPEKWWAPQNWSQAGSSPADQVIRLLDELTRTNPVDIGRIYLMGLSMGGNGTWYLLTKYPGRFAAGIPICGWGNAEQVVNIKNTPIWAFHGDADKVVPVERSRELIEALRQAGVNPRYTEYAGTGHDSWTPALAEPELLTWLFAQKKSRK